MVSKLISTLLQATLAELYSIDPGRTREFLAGFGFSEADVQFREGRNRPGRRPQTIAVIVRMPSAVAQIEWDNLNARPPERDR